MKSFITGNTFPINLIRRKVRIVPETFENYCAALNQGQWESFWGHANTLPIVNSLVGKDLTPKIERPAISIDNLGYPSLFGKSYSECWILSPNYIENFRPAIGVEVKASDIKSWDVLHMFWE